MSREAKLKFMSTTLTIKFPLLIIKVVIITNLGQRQNQHKMLKIQQIFPTLYRCLLHVVFHNLKPQNAGIDDVKKDLNLKRSKGIFVRENLKNKHR